MFPLILPLLALTAAILSTALFLLWRKLEALRSIATLHAVAQAALTRSERAQEQLTHDIESLQSQLETARNGRAQTEQALALAQQTIRTLQTSQQEDAARLEEVKQLTRAGVLHVGQELSSKLLDDARREREAEAEKRQVEAKQVRESTQKELETLLQNVTEQLTQLHGKTAALDSHHKQLSADLLTINRALTNPIAAGAQAEIGFENLLTNLGLIAGQDFFLQYQFESEEGRTLRPDCVVLLPQETALVIDCKSSPYVLELAATEGTAEYDAVLKKFAASMHAHLKSLASKEYANAIQKLLKTETRKPIQRIISVMYCPTEAALERVLKYDGSLREKSATASIVLAGPASLQGLFQIAKLQVMQAQQTANQQQILAVLSQWMSDVMAALTYADKIGSSIRTAMSAYDQLAGSVNRNVIGRMQRLITLGVEPAKAGNTPKKLTRYEITQANDVITSEAEEVAEILVLETAANST